MTTASDTSALLLIDPAEFADPPPPRLEKLTLSPATDASQEQPLVPLDLPPSTLIEWGVLILNTPDPDLKVV